MKPLFVLVFFFIAATLSAEELDIELDDGIEVPVEYIEADGEKMLLWLPPMPSSEKLLVLPVSLEVMD